MRTSLGILLSVWATVAHANDVDCLLEVRGTSYLDGVCNGEFLQGGSFTLGLGGEEDSQYFVSVRRNSDGTATAHWNGPGGSNSADHPLGTLSRSGACWIGEQTKVCAWRIGEDRWFADANQTSPVAPPSVSVQVAPPPLAVPLPVPPAIGAVGSSDGAPYLTKLEAIFTGRPPQAEIKALMDQALASFGQPASEENYELLGNALVRLRRETRVTEISILRCMPTLGSVLNHDFLSGVALCAVSLQLN
jgi:hypothetical protein